jgi:hypothetical protein
MRIFRFTTAARNRSLRSMQYVTAILLASAIVLTGSNVANSRGSKPEAMSHQQVRERSHPAPSTQTVYAPGGLKKFSQAEILLNNRSPDSRDVTAVFYTAEGTAVTGRTVTLKPAEIRSMELADLMISDHPIKKKVTGVMLTYFGGMMEVAAQITLPGAHGAGSVDIPFSGAMDYHSNVQEAVWWMSEGAEATIILGNASEQIRLPNRFGILPSNYAGVIVLHRLQLDNRTYLGNNLTQSNSNTPDDSDPIYRDDNPQSGGSNGKVYDLDAPRLGSTPSDPTGTVWRARSNFRQWATLGASGAKVSSDFGWFSRLSVIKIGSSDQLRTDVTNDNIAGSGTTKLTWNLQ